MGTVVDLDPDPDLLNNDTLSFLGCSFLCSIQELPKTIVTSSSSKTSSFTFSSLLHYQPPLYSFIPHRFVKSFLSILEYSSSQFPSTGSPTLTPYIGILFVLCFFFLITIVIPLNMPSMGNSVLVDIRCKCKSICPYQNELSTPFLEPPRTHQVLHQVLQPA